MNEERSDAGDPIFRYQQSEKPGWTPPEMLGSSIEAIDAHITKYIGPITNVWHEILSDIVHIDVHQVAPTPERPYYTLVTSGMSDLPMKAPRGEEAHRYAELMLCLPPDWPMSDLSFKDDEHYWPIRWLKILARFPHQYGAWLWNRHTMPNGDPATPFAKNVGWTCMMLGRPKTVSTDFWELQISDEKTVHFFSLLPIYPEETELKLREGAEVLLQRLEQAKHTELINLRRSNVAKPWWNVF